MWPFGALFTKRDPQVHQGQAAGGAESRGAARRRAGCLFQVVFATRDLKILSNFFYLKS